MKTKLLFATNNNFKFALMKKRLQVFDSIELISPKTLGIQINVIENGKTAEENSIKKATAYYNATKIPTIAEDAGLYIDKFKDEEQPGLFVKRINGKEGLSDREIFNYYLNKIKDYGGSSKAHYYTGVAIVDSNGTVHSDTFNETEFLLTSEVCPIKSIDGGILEPMSFDIEANKYFNERTSTEEDHHYEELNMRYRQLIKQYIINA